MWQGWDTIDVPARKKKSCADIFIMFNSSIDTLAISKMDLVKSAPIRYKNTIYTKNEKFFCVPLYYFKFYHFNGFC